MDCILCGSGVELIEVWRENKYYSCNNCKSIMLDPRNYISNKKEKERYEKHDNDVEDKGYQDFVYPIVKEVLNEKALEWIKVKCGYSNLKVEKNIIIYKG